MYVNLSKDNMRIHNKYSIDTSAQLIEGVNADLDNFINIEPTDEGKEWVLLNYLPYYYHSYIYNKKHLIPANNKLNYPRNYKSFSPYYRLFVNLQANIPRRISVNGEFYSIGRGIILKSDNTPLLYLKALIDRRVEEGKKVFEVLDIKAYVDYSIFNSDKSTEKFIRKTILPTLAQESYHIEIDKLTKASIGSSPQMPKNTHKYKDYVYSTLKNNINKLKRLIQNE